MIASAAPAWPQDAPSPWVRNDHAGVRLIAATATAGTSDVIRVGLHFTLRPGWKTYWRNPGDAGFAPRADWSRSENVADVALRWPAPERFELFGLETFGYADEVVLPLEYKGERLAKCYVIDLVVGGTLLVEIKAVERLMPIHTAQLITYLRLKGLSAGLLVNFHVEQLVRGVRRVLL